MHKQKLKTDMLENQFQELGGSSPEMKPLQQDDLNQVSSTERSDSIDKSSPNSTQINNFTEKQTTLIKIMPVLQLNESEDTKQNDKIQQNSNHKKNRRKRVLKLQSRQYQSVESSGGQSPIVFELQMESDREKSQIFGFSPPQSSRRGLNPKRRQKRSRPPHPPQITQKTQKTQSTFRQEQNKKNNKIDQKKQKLATEIYKYQEQSDQSKSLQSDSEQQDDYQQEEKDKVQQIQYKFQRKKNEQQQNKDDKKQMFFKSNSFFTLINAQIPKGRHINCILRKKKEGIFSLTTKYELFLYDDKKYLMTAVKTSYKLTSHFEFYKDKEISQSGKKSKECLYGILDSNFSGTQYVLKTVIQYDTISQRSTAIDRRQMIMQQSQSVISDQCSQQKIVFPQTQKKKQPEVASDLQIRQACYIHFKAGLMGLGGQRDVTILKKNNKKIANSGKFSDLKNAFDNGQFQKLKEITTRKAQQGSQGYQLDFKGFAKVNSDKNIILQNNKGVQNLIFGKAKQDIYFLSISYPFSILQGFAFGVSNLDGKVFVN